MFNISSGTQVVRDAVHNQTNLFIEDINRSTYGDKIVLTSLDFSHLFPPNKTGYTNVSRNQVSIFMHGNLNFPNVRAVHVGFTPEQGDIYNIIPT